jgi:RimJ/RimL family protein N-acetyltransferase
MNIQTQVIRTARLDLLPLRVEHAEQMSTVLSDPGLYTYIGGTPPTRAELRVRYQRLVTGSPDPAVVWCNWVIQLRDSTHLTGTVQATVTTHGPGRTAEIAWVVGTAWQRRGIATEAAQGLITWLAQQHVQTVIAHIHPDHQASNAVAMAAGLLPTGQWHDGEAKWQSGL